MSTYKLVEIPRNSLLNLRNLFLQNWPEHILGYDLINNYIRWFNQDPNYDKAKILSLNGDWSDGTFLIIVRKLKFIILYCSVNKLPLLGS